MAIKDSIRGVAAVALLAACLAEAGLAQGISAEDAFRDGNRLFRDNLYWAALLRYEEAANAGMNSAALHYNIGVAHYKARQYERAARSLERAAMSPRLKLLASYNLGLTEYAMGNNAAALRLFREARDQNESAKISALADKAIARLRNEVLTATANSQKEIVADPDEREMRPEPRKLGEFEGYARVGFGSDDNVYLTPAETYIDVSNPGQPATVDPIIQSGSFVPVSLGAKYTLNTYENESFFFRYRGTGRYYPDVLLSNANEQTHEIGFGSESSKDRENGTSQLFTAFTMAYHDEVFFDRDDGEVPIINDIEVFNRYAYIRFGPEIRARRKWDKLAVEVWGKAQLWNYENALELPEYDHEYFRAGGLLQYRFTKTSLLRLTAQYYQRNFGDRPAFELDGSQPVGNPGVEYEYADYGLTARQRLTRNFWFGVKYVFTDRVDNYLGYNDYTRDGFGAEVHLRLGNRFRLDAEALYRIYNFTNAFAFNNPVAGRKTLESADGRLSISYDMPWNLRLVGDYTYRDVTSNDARIAFERSLFMLSLQWAND